MVPGFPGRLEKNRDSKMKGYSKFMLCFLCLMLAVACAGCRKSPADKKGEIRPPRINVKTDQVRSAGNLQEIKYSGTIEESQSIPLSFPVVGIVSRVLVSEGDYVRKGQLLAELDNESYRNSYEMAVASEKQARDAYNRLKTLYANGNLPEMKLVDVETKLQQAKSAAAIARKNLRDCRLYALTDGLVGKRSIERGMNSVPNITAIKLVKINRVYAVISVSENEIASVRYGDRASVDIKALGSRIYRGRVREVGVIADPLAHTYRVKIAMDNPGYSMKPGMICDVALLRKKARISFTVPSRSVMVDNDGKNFVYSVDETGEKAQKKYITTGRLMGSSMEVLSGLKPGETVVVSGQHKLSDSSLIDVIEE